MICVLGGLGNLIGGFIAAFVMSQFIALGGFFLDSEWGYVIAFVFFILVMFLRPQGLFGKRS
jgi:branched-chain amino acid transport system permease protein